MPDLVRIEVLDKGQWREMAAGARVEQLVALCRLEIARRLWPGRQFRLVEVVDQRAELAALLLGKGRR